MEYKGDLNEAKALIGAIDRSNAIIEFTVDGEIIDANAMFLQCMGYTIDEIRGKHHRIFVEPKFAVSSQYTEFWDMLKKGTFCASDYMRLAKGGREVWLQATYNPVLGADGKVLKVIKLATEVTNQKLSSANATGKIDAVEKSMAVIEFNTDGSIIRANDLFLDRMGYEAHEIEGKHHRMFVDKEFAASQAYAQFWADLAQGKFNRGRFERFDKAGESVWLEATYSPIFDPNGKPVKIVKFAYDITAQVRQGEALEAALAEAQEAEKMRNELDRAVQEMSTPVTPIWEGILLLPLVGVLDSMRTSDIMNKSLSMISEMRAKVFVLDISGVATVDTAVANQLIKITKATRLMGCEAIVSGLSPAIARTIVELGVNVEAIRTTATLRDAFEKALVMVGESLIGKKANDTDAHKVK
ncbi:PAS domain-containing protein [Candidatus Magnetominusculus xianensis]|uniref:Chemotaxis protein n=1 Tax=Candidatus Magnetominusculus xianensis TaxID=1748249 RepID=A0ABR5SIP9_9BACT|nr:PAS domain-containing protein [Candidatus Magnetominusculus xianensis]KWT92815.1 chemotaxis protein [Candidatus Magnetominusculus xianensis]MBF0403404.1 PAS domain-containing protein [Nitrospirota bacterium]